jgi:energy-coupling factor transporter ATP-binding protein EcfA2
MGPLATPVGDGRAVRPAATGGSIEVEGLVRRFGELEAVCGIDLRVEAGEIFGFLGPNGAGKSTTVRMLTTLLRPTAGRAVVAGHGVVERDVDFHRRPRRELHLTEIAEEDCFLIAGIDDRDRPHLDDRRGALGDRQRHLHLRLLRITGVLDGDRKAEGGRRDDRVLVAPRKLVTPRQRSRRYQSHAVRVAASGAVPARW